MVVSVARKPLKSPTVIDSILDTGCGGLNIDACRIGTEITKTIGTSMGRGNNLGTCWHTDTLSESDKTHVGRFPTNLILQHHSSCTDILCDPCCPIQNLDTSVGVKSSGQAGKKQESTMGHAGNRSSAYGKESRKAGEQQVGYGDSGYVSRFFYVVFPGDTQP